MKGNVQKAVVNTEVGSARKESQNQTKEEIDGCSERGHEVTDAPAGCDIVQFINTFMTFLPCCYKHQLTPSLDSFLLQIPRKWIKTVKM